MHKTKKCSVCNSSMEWQFQLKILNKHMIDYFLCSNCGLLQTESPFWLEEAYKSAIAELDTGILNRNLLNSQRLEPVLFKLFPQNVKLVDEAGGYGLLTRFLRDKGFDCYSYDKFCENIFAKDFIPSTDFSADAVLAFEVFEHLENVSEFISDSFRKYNCKTIIFSTLVFENEVPSKDWWYYTVESGQHISFYQPKTLSTIAKSVGCTYYRITKNFHIITDKKFSFWDKVLLLNPLLFKLYYLLVRFLRRNKSKIHEDFNLINNRLKKE